MARKSNFLYFQNGIYLTIAGQQNGPVFHSHLMRMKQGPNQNVYNSSFRDANQTTRDAAIAAGSFFYCRLDSGVVDMFYLRSIRFGITKPSTETNVKIDVMVSDDKEGQYAELLKSFVWNTAATSATVTVDINKDVYIGDGPYILLVIYGATSATSNFIVDSRSYIQYEYDTNDVAYLYPLEKDTFRTVENRPGIVYDANKKTSVFAEDMIMRSNGILGLQDALGVVPTGMNYNMQNAIYSRNRQELENYVVSTTANTGTVSDVSVPTLEATPDGYYLSGYIGGIFSSASGRILYYNTNIRDMDTTEIPIAYTDVNTGDQKFGTIAGDPGNGRFILNLATGLNNDGFEGLINVRIGRQIELWQLKGAQYPT